MSSIWVSRTPGSVPPSKVSSVELTRPQTSLPSGRVKWISYWPRELAAPSAARRRARIG